MALVLGIWIAVALAVTASLGFSSEGHLAGLKSAPLMAAELLTPDRHSFRLLPDTPATAVLRRDLGQGGISAADGRKLYDLVVRHGYRRVLDVGTGYGYAALWLGMAMTSTGGKVITIEIDPATARLARDHIREAQMDGVIESRIDDALREIPAIPGDFDLVFLDLGGAHHKELFDLLYSRVAPGGTIVSHNAFALRFTAPAYLPAVQRTPDMETRIVPTLSGGLAISVKARG
jgi:predicted O-methyltransferase YrrM